MVASALHTDGQYFKTTSGTKAYLRGVDKGLFLVASSGGYPSYTPYESALMHADVDRMSGYNINCIRTLVNMSWWYTNPSYCWNGPVANSYFKTCLTEFVSYCNAKNIYVLIEPWQIVGMTSPGGGGQSGMETAPWGISPISNVADYVAWWLDVSTYYKNYPNVIYGMWNEPHLPDYTSFKNACVQAITAIRTQTDTPCLVQWGYSGGMEFAPDFMDDLSILGNCGIQNHIYRTPTYATFPDQSVITKTAIKSYLNATWNYDDAIGHYPVVIGELGAWDGVTNENTWHQNMLAALNDWEAGYACWIWDQNYGGAYGLLQYEAGPLMSAGVNLVDAIAAAPPPPPLPTKTFSFDGLLQGTRTKTFSLDGLLKLISTKELSLDAVLTESYGKTFTLDALLQAAQTKGFSLDGYLEALKTKIFEFDALLKLVSTKTFTLDGELQAEGYTKQFTLDGLLWAEKYRFSMDALLEAYVAAVNELGLLRRVIREMEKKQIGNYFFEAGFIEPGFDNCDTPLRRAIRKLEGK